MAKKTKTLICPHPEMTQERIYALQDFARMYGDDWPAAMVRYHMGRPDYRGRDLVPFIRQIRNHVTANPAELRRYL